MVCSLFTEFSAQLSRPQRKPSDTNAASPLLTALVSSKNLPLATACSLVPAGRRLPEGRAVLALSPVILCAWPRVMSERMQLPVGLQPAGQPSRWQLGQGQVFSHPQSLWVLRTTACPGSQARQGIRDNPLH